MLVLLLRIIVQRIRHHLHPLAHVRIALHLRELREEVTQQRASFYKGPDRFRLQLGLVRKLNWHANHIADIGTDFARRPLGPA